MNILRLSGFKEKGAFIRVFTLFMICLLLCFIVACERRIENSVTEDAEEEEEEEYPASSKDNFVILNFTDNLLALDPVHANDPDMGTFSSVIYDSLTYHDYDGNITPGLAVSWKQIGDKTYQFKLREGVRFHNGQEFDAYDVKYTIDTHLNPEIRSATALVWNNSHLVHVKEVAVVDKYTVNFILHSDSGIINHMMHMFSAVLPKDYPLKKLREHPVGTGPYKFVKWDSRKQIVLTRNEDYWKPGIPKIKNLVFKILPVDQWLETIIAGKADFIMHLPGKYRKKIEADVHSEIMERPVLSSIWISLKNKGPLKDVRVRKALNHAVDMEKIIRYAEYGKGIVLASIGRKGEYGYNEELTPYKYNLDKARVLMMEAGYEKGFTLKAFATDITETVMGLVKEDLMDINVELELEIVPPLQYVLRAPYMSHIYGTKSTEDYDITAWIVDNPVINMLFNCDTLLLSNMSHIEHTPYNYKEYEIFHNWANISNPVVHEKRLKELDKYIHDNAYFLFTYQRVLTSAIRKNIHMKKLNVNGHLEFGMLTETTKE